MYTIQSRYIISVLLLIGENPFGDKFTEGVTSGKTNQGMKTVLTFRSARTLKVFTKSISHIYFFKNNNFKH